MTRFQKLSLGSTAATILLVAIGGLVRATKSGLGCGTDWPHCQGHLVPSMESRAVVIEYSHRVTATVVVVLRHGRIEQVATPAELLADPATDYVRTLLQRARVTQLEIA